MKLQHKGQKYRKWRVIKWQRAQACRGITAEYPYHDYDFVALRTKIWSERYQEHLYIEYFASVKLMQEPSALVMILRHEMNAMEDERAQAEHEMTSP